jgi:hypothetical protein
LNLPAFNIPRLPAKKVPADVYHQWLLSNIRRLDEAGMLERARSLPGRRPVDARFRLK